MNRYGAHSTRNRDLVARGSTSLRHRRTARYLALRCQHRWSRLRPYLALLQQMFGQHSMIPEPTGTHMAEQWCKRVLALWFPPRPSTHRSQRLVSGEHLPGLSDDDQHMSPMVSAICSGVRRAQLTWLPGSGSSKTAQRALPIGGRESWRWYSTNRKVRVMAHGNIILTQVFKMISGPRRSLG